MSNPSGPDSISSFSALRLSRCPIHQRVPGNKSDSPAHFRKPIPEPKTRIRDLRPAPEIDAHQVFMKMPDRDVPGNHRQSPSTSRSHPDRDPIPRHSLGHHRSSSATTKPLPRSIGTTPTIRKPISSATANAINPLQFRKRNQSATANAINPLQFKPLISIYPLLRKTISSVTVIPQEIIHQIDPYLNAHKLLDDMPEPTLCNDHFPRKLARTPLDETDVTRDLPVYTHMTTHEPDPTRNGIRCILILNRILPDFTAFDESNLQTTSNLVFLTRPPTTNSSPPPPHQIPGGFGGFDRSEPKMVVTQDRGEPFTPVLDIGVEKAEPWDPLKGGYNGLFDNGKGGGYQGLTGNNSCQRGDNKHGPEMMNKQKAES
ncbi:hypothetical protein LXL04_015697 [Taraxacum kok-saghyz]